MSNLETRISVTLNQDGWWIDVTCTEYWCKDDAIGTYYKEDRSGMGQDIVDHLMRLHTLSDAQLITNGPVSLVKYNDDDVPF